MSAVAEAISSRTLTHLRALEAESIHIIREVAAEFAKPVMLYSIGKDSSVMLRLAQKAFYPGPIPFPLLHIDTSFKFREMIEFRDQYPGSIGANLLVYRNEEAIADGANPYKLGTQKCCGFLKTRALLDGLGKYGFDAAFGGARRDEEKSRAKERIYSFRDAYGQWDPKNQRPELWNIYNARIDKGETIRVFPLSNWTELDVWQYIHLENIPIVPLYFAKERPMVVRGESLLPIEHDPPLLPGEEAQDGDVPHAVARMHALYGRNSFRCGHAPEDYRRTVSHAPLRTRKSHHRPRSGRLDGAEEARGLFLNGRSTIRDRRVPRAGAAQRTSSIHHRRKCGRWKIHTDWPFALRFQRCLRRSTGVGEKGVGESFRPARSISRCSRTA